MLGNLDKSPLITAYRQLANAQTRFMILRESLRVRRHNWVAPLVRSALTETSDSLREMGITLAHLSANDDLLDPLLGTLGAEKNEEMRCLLLQAIGRCGKDHQKAKDLLIKSTTKSNSSRVRGSAYIGLGFLSPDPSVPDLLFRRGVKDREGPARDGAIWALANLGQKKAVRRIDSMIQRTENRLRRDFYRLAIKRLETTDPLLFDRDAWEAARREIARGKRR